MFEIASKLWLSAWAESREKHTDYNIIDSEELSTTDYISVYGAFGLLQVHFYQNHEEDCANFCSLLRKAELYDSGFNRLND